MSPPIIFILFFIPSSFGTILDRIFPLVPECLCVTDLKTDSRLEFQPIINVNFNSTSTTNVTQFVTQKGLKASCLSVVSSQLLSGNWIDAFVIWKQIFRKDIFFFVITEDKEEGEKLLLNSYKMQRHF